MNGARPVHGAHPFRAAAVALALAALGFGCRENIVAPGSCPELCPASRVQIVDTTITGLVVGDSSYQGYVSLSEAGVLFLSDLDSLQGGGVARFSPVAFTWIPGVNDTVVSADRVPDSVTLSFTVADRDTAAHNVWVLVYRLPFNFDTMITYDALRQVFADSLLVDSVFVPDTVASGSVTQRLRAGALDTVPASDSGVVSLAFRVRADTRTALSLASSEEYGGAARLSWHMKAQAPRDSLKHTFTATPDYDSFVFSPARPYDGTSLVAGGLPSSRTILRFSDSLPPEATDSLGLVRATLILTPTRPAFGRPRERFRVSARGVVRDVGAKSSIFADTAAGGTVEVVAGDSGEVRIEIGRMLRLWGTSAGDSLPRVLMLLSSPEGYGMGEVTVAGRGAGAAAPRLHLTYVRPYEFGVP